MSFVAYDFGKKSYSAAVVCQEKKNSITSGFGGKHSFPAKSPIPPTEPHPLPINVKWSLFLPVPLLLSSSVPSLPNVPLFLCSSCFVPC